MEGEAPTADDFVGPGMIPLGGPPSDMTKTIKVALPRYPGGGRESGPTIVIEAFFGEEETTVDVSVEGPHPNTHEGYQAVIDVIKHLT